MTILLVPFAFALAIGIMAGALELIDRRKRCDCAFCDPQRWIQ